MKLTGKIVPISLTHVHVRVEVEGSLHVKTYEADPNLTHIFAWNKRNVYKQKVYTFFHYPTDLLTLNMLSIYCTNMHFL